MHGDLQGNQATILALETATSTCSAALLCNGRVSELSEVGNNIHSKVLLAMVKSLLEQENITAQNLDAVAVGQGPGSFTGLRIGVGVGQGIAYGANCPMVEVTSLDALANSMLSNSELPNSVDDESQYQDKTLIAGIDARMGEVYWAEYSYKANGYARCSDIALSLPQDINSNADDLLLVGNAWGEYWQSLNSDLIEKSVYQERIASPTAASVLALAEKKYNAGETVSSLEFSPLYVRNDVAKKSTKPLPGKRV